MVVTIAARFESSANANSAAHALFACGVAPEAVSVFFAPESGPTRPDPSELDQDPRKFSVRFYAQMNVAILAMLGALLGAAPVFTLDGPAGAVAAGAAIGAFIGSWTGAVWLAAKALGQRDQRLNRYALLTVELSPMQERDVIEILRDAGGAQVKRAAGRWLDAEVSGAVEFANRPRQPWRRSTDRQAAPRSRGHRLQT